MEFEWNIFPGFTTLQLINSKDVHDIIWGSEDNEGNALNATLVSIFAKRFPAGRWSFLRPGIEKKWYSTYTDRPENGTESLNR